MEEKDQIFEFQKHHINKWDATDQTIWFFYGI